MNWKDNPWFPSVLQRTRQRDMADRPDSYEHVWEGGFATVFHGAYYVSELVTAKNAGRIDSVEVQPGFAGSQRLWT